MSDSENSATKRPHQESAGEDSDDGWVGPLPSQAAPTKKKKVLEHESLYLENLPCADSYERSYM
jgi:peptidylprolyl isomerase domain and WD repeat-containing protein 1